MTRHINQWISWNIFFEWANLVVTEQLRPDDK